MLDKVNIKLLSLSVYFRTVALSILKLPPYLKNVILEIDVTILYSEIHVFGIEFHPSKFVNLCMGRFFN